MKTYKHLWDDFISKRNIQLALNNALKSSDKNKKTKAKLRKIRDNFDLYYPRLCKLACNYYNAPHVPKEIYDGISRKKRTIIVPTAYEQIIHHMIVNILKPIFMKSYYYHSYGSVPGKGVHKGAKTIKRWIKVHEYVLKMDVTKCFDSVNQDILIEKLEKIIKDEQFMNVLRTIIRVTDFGIPLGFYTSQWFINFYLTDFDHYVTNDLGCGKYIRYVDDMVIFGHSSEELHKIKRQITAYLFYDLDLRVKPNWQIFRINSRPLDFMGFKFYSYKTTIRGSIFLKSIRKTRRTVERGYNAYRASQILCYWGWYKCTDTKQAWKKHISNIISIQQLKGLVSKRSKIRYYQTTKRRLENYESI